MLHMLKHVTGWMGENHFSALPLAMYGVVLMMAGFAYWLLQQTIICSQGENSILAQAVGRDVKGKLSVILYMLAIGVTIFCPWMAALIYTLVACMWLVPDRRIECALTEV